MHPINYTCVCISTLVYVFLAVADEILQLITILIKNLSRFLQWAKSFIV